MGVIEERVNFGVCSEGMSARGVYGLQVVRARNVAVATGIGSLGLQAILGSITDVLAETHRTRTDLEKAVRSLRQSIVPAAKVHVSLAAQNDPSADKRKIFVHADQSDAVIAHELGHVRNYESSATKWTLQAAALNGLRPFTGIASGLYGAAADWPSYVPACAHLAMSAFSLVSEGMASLHALPALELRPKWPRSAATLAVAFGTYALPAVTPLIVTAVKRHLVESAPWSVRVNVTDVAHSPRSQ